MASPFPSPTSEALTRVVPRRFVRNVVSTYAAHVIIGLQLVIVTPLLVHGLGPELYGVWALVTSMGVIVSLLDLGLGSATTRYVAQYDALRDRSAVVSTLAVSFWTLVSLGGLAFLVGGALTPLFVAAFAPRGEETATALLIVLVTASVAITFVGGAFSGCLTGFQRYTINNAFSAAVAVFQAAGFAIVLELGRGLVSLGAVLVGVALAAQIGRYIAVRRLVPEMSLSPRMVKRDSAKEILRMTLWISSVHVATAIRYRVDTLVVGFVAGVRQAAVYAVGQLLFLAVHRFISPALTGFFPLAAELGGRRDPAALRSAMLTGTRIALAVAGPLCSAGILLAGPAVYAWVGPGFGDAEVVVVCLLSALFLGAITRAALLMLQGSGDVRPPVVILWLEATLNLALSIGLGLLAGVAGVAAATLIATATVSVAFAVPYVCRTYGLSTAAFVASIARSHVPPLLAAALVALLVRPDEGANVGTVIVAGLCIVLAYLATLAVTGLSRDERARLAGRLRRSGALPLWRLRLASKRSSQDR